MRTWNSGIRSCGWRKPNFAAGTERASRSGIPILFPFPGRIPGTYFDWSGKRYHLEVGDQFGNAIHGFVHTRPWQILELEDSFVVAEFDSAEDEPALAEQWPGQFRITARYELCSDALEMEYTIGNPGTTPLPFGLGLHPYFRLNFAGSPADACQVLLPVTQEWELKDMLPTGERRLVVGAEAWRQLGREFRELNLDNVFTGLEAENGSVRATMRDPAMGRALHIEFDETFRELVVFTPPHREAICIEPYTCVPGAVVYEPQGWDAGLCVLPPGDKFVTRVAISVE